MTANRCGVALQGDENILEVDKGDVCTTLRRYYKQWNYTLKGLPLCYVNFISIFKRRRGLVPPGII